MEPVEAAPAPARRPDRPLSRVVRYTWSRQWPAEALMGASGGVLNLVPFCLQRSMGAPQWTSQWIIVLGQGLWLFAPVWPPLLARMRRPAAFAWIGAFSRGPLLFMAFASVVAHPNGRPDYGLGDWWILFATFLLSNNLDALYTPHRNALIRANYPLAVRGRIYGLVSAVVGLASMAAAFAVGWLMDRDATGVRIVFPVAGVVGVVAHLLLSRIRWRYDGPLPVQAGGGLSLARDAVGNAWRATKATLRTDRAFLHFEIGFMLYGLGLLSAGPLIVTRFAQDKGFDTSDWAIADRVVFPGVQLLCIWFVGRLSDRIGILRLSSRAFALLIPYFLLMTVVKTPHHLFAVNALLGVALAFVNVAWALGPLHFAPPGQAHHYSAIHVAAVGLRSVVGPLVGWFVQTALSFDAALIVSACLEAFAAVWMLRLSRRSALP